MRLNFSVSYAFREPHYSKIIFLKIIYNNILKYSTAYSQWHKRQWYIKILLVCFPSKTSKLMLGFICTNTYVSVYISIIYYLSNIGICMYQDKYFIAFEYIYWQGQGFHINFCTLSDISNSDEFHDSTFVIWCNCLEK
jgi:hypothetical protein